ncbi:MAG: carbohydrate ABC transporter permease [Clostridia bacterium]|nr:carbohydrate ABC transporter permease [Clostridia bacterium]
MTENKEFKPQIKRETKNKIRVEFERTDLKERLKTKYLSAYFAKRVIWYIFRLLLLIGIAFVVIQPFITMITKSFMAPQDFRDTTVVNIPRNLSAGIYKAIFVDLHYIKVFFTTMGTSLACALLQTASCCLVGYGLAKFKFRGAKAVFFCVVLTLIIPHGSLQAAIFQRFSRFDILGIFKFLSGTTVTGIGWLDNILSKIHVLNMPMGIQTTNSIAPLLILSVTGLAFKNGLYIFMLRQFFRGVPDELEESAYLDGAGTFRTFVQVILPISIPMMVTVFLLAFCWQWTDDFYVPLFFVKDPQASNLMNYLASDLPPASLALDYTQTTGKSPEFMKAMEYGCGMMACLPLIILFLFCQKQLVQGIERSGIVG